MSRHRSRWLRLGVGTAVLGTAFAVLARGPLVPGTAGQVLRHNRDHDLQATALFYTDLDRMPEIQARLERLRSGRPEGQPTSATRMGRSPGP